MRLPASTPLASISTSTSIQDRGDKKKQQSVCWSWDSRACYTAATHSYVRVKAKVDTLDYHVKCLGAYK